MSDLCTCMECEDCVTGLLFEEDPHPFADNDEEEEEYGTDS